MKAFILRNLSVAPAAAIAFAGLQFCVTPVQAGSPIATDTKQIEAPKETPEDPWKLTLAVPGWLANTEGTTGVNGLTSHVNVGVDTILKHLNMIAAFSGEARKGRFGIYGDFMYVSAGGGVNLTGVVKNVNVHMDQYLADMELNFRVFEGDWGYVDVRAGARYNNLYDRVTLAANEQAIQETSEKIVDDASRRISTILKQKLSEFNLEQRIVNAVNARIDQKVKGIEQKDPILPVAPLTGRTPDAVREAVNAIVDRRTPALAAALSAAASADAAALKAAADARVVTATATVKTAAQQAKIDAANRIAAKADQVRAVVQQRVNTEKRDLQKDISRTLKSKLNTSASVAQQWIDPYIGFAARYNLNKAFYLTAKADVGGFGLGSEFTSQGSAAIGCQITRYIFSEVGYRYLYTDYSRTAFVYDVMQSGFQITTGIVF